MIANNTFGRTSASASFAAGSSWLPELRVYASSGLGRGASGQVFASQRFVYSGAGEEVTLAINLHGDVTDGPTGYTFNSLWAQTAVLVGDSLPWYPSVYELVHTLFPARVVLSKEMGLNSSTGSSIGATGTFRLNPGDVFYVVSDVLAYSRNGTVDSSGTLTMALTSNLTGQAVQNLIPTSPVPEASRWATMALGLLMLGALRYRRRNCQPGSRQDLSV